jgi:hypothetical protein
MQIFCAPSGSKGTAYVTTMDSVKRCATVHKEQAGGHPEGLTFQLGSKTEGTESRSVRGGTASVQLSPKVKTGGHSHELPRGKYRVGVQLSSGGRHSKTDHITLVIP